MTRDKTNLQYKQVYSTSYKYTNIEIYSEVLATFFDTLMPFLVGNHI